MTDGWFRARDLMRCYAIQKKPPSASCGCCAKVKCDPSKAVMWMCAAKQFASMAIRPAQLSSRVSCEHNWNAKASESARRKPAMNICHSERSEESQIICPNPPHEIARDVRFAQHDRLRKRQKVRWPFAKLAPALTR